ncbi:glycosyltransferase [Stygiobacter electus]|uniref:Glycosyltransferase n=1 Tax=Stygiobacter electus TaxID=3032292 RepID=A0AAE3NWX9_9BACT|nr:glycosyltransferase [Stygiobacter electus]MDF1612476.1 glycosyltransferase [Stygiobacter electus]
MYKVLVIAYYYPPMGLSGVQRVLKFTKYMHKFNWQPTVITAGNVAYFAHDLSLLKEAEEAGVEIIRTDAFDINSILGAKYNTVSMPKELIRKFLSRLSKTFFIPDNKNSWSKKAYQVAKEKLSKEKFDMIFVSVPPYSQFVMAAKLKKEFGLPLFVDYRDLWYENHFAFYITPYHKYKHKKLEYNALKETEKVIAINRKIKEKILLTYPFLKYDDVIIIPHGFDQEDFDKNEPYKKLNSKMKLTYSGIFYENITPEYFLRAFKELTIENPEIANNIELEFIGHLRKENKNLINELGLNSYVIEYGYLEHDEVIKRLNGSDVLWMMIGNIKNAETISTSKLFEYFGARKPILGCVPEGAAKQALKEYGASFITNPDYIDEIKNAIKEIYNLYVNNNLPVANEEFIEKHNREKLTEQLVTAFQFYLRTE